MSNKTDKSQYPQHRTAAQGVPLPTGLRKSHKNGGLGRTETVESGLARLALRQSEDKVAVATATSEKGQKLLDAAKARLIGHRAALEAAQKATGLDGSEEATGKLHDAALVVFEAEKEVSAAAEGAEEALTALRSAKGSLSKAKGKARKLWTGKSEEPAAVQL